MLLKYVRTLLRQTYSEWQKHNAPRLGAALAFYTVLSLAPLLLLVIKLGSILLDRADAQNQILMQAQALLGDQGASVVKTVLMQKRDEASGNLASLLGIMTLLYAAGGALVELRADLNIIWGLAPADYRGISGFIRSELLSFGMVLVTGFLLLVSLVISASLAALGGYMEALTPAPGWILEGANFFLSAIVIAGVFALLFEYLPDQRTPWGPVLVGGLVTSLLFAVGKSLIGLYLGKAAVGSAYGAAGSLVVLVAWVYYSAQLFLFGAEFTHIYAQAWGDPVPAPSTAG